jgi:hypothetical protein
MATSIYTKLSLKVGTNPLKVIANIAPPCHNLSVSTPQRLLPFQLISNAARFHAITQFFSQAGSTKTTCQFKKLWPYAIKTAKYSSFYNYFAAAKKLGIISTQRMGLKTKIMRGAMFAEYFGYGSPFQAMKSVLLQQLRMK